jgi:hypothetical protein
VGDVLIHVLLSAEIGGVGTASLPGRLTTGERVPGNQWKRGCSRHAAQIKKAIHQQKLFWKYTAYCIMYASVTPTSDVRATAM